MRNPSKILVFKNSTIKDALNKLESSKEKLLICVDKKKKFLGVINDGDLRRAIIKGANLDRKIENFIKDNAVVANYQINPNDALKLLNSRIMVLPIIDHFSKVIGYYTLKDVKDLSNFKNKDVVIIGMGFVGLTLSVMLADVGMKVYGYDNNIKKINELKKGKVPFYEKGFNKIFNFHNNKNLVFINKLNKNIGSIYIIAVGTPLKKNTNSPDLNSIIDVAKKVGKVIKDNDLIILRSTIPIGCTRKIVIPNIEKASNLKAGKNFYISFAPERTAEGVAILELKKNPQIIGGYDIKSSELTANLFNNFTHSIVNVNSIESAEFCKLIDNSYRDHRFAYINQMVELSEKLKIDLNNIVDAVNHGYPRNNIPKPSPGVGGPCLTKDPYILNSTFKKHKLDSSLILDSRRINKKVPDLLFKKLNKMLKKTNKNINTAKIFIIGIAFKGEPETSDFRNSTSLDFINKFRNKENIKIYDPVINPKELKKLKLKFSNIKNGFKGSDVAIILNNHKSYLDMNIYSLIKSMKSPSIFIDTWHIFEPSEIKQLKGVLYGGIGVN
jgi:UDP-N-acetyl-D-mannosaminuronic acid dehydrogenase